MPALPKSSEPGLTGANSFAFSVHYPRNPFEEQPWSLDFLERLQEGQWTWDDLEPDDAPDNILHVDFTSLAASPEAVRLRRNERLHAKAEATAATTPRLTRMSILDLSPLNLGEILRPLGPDDDLLGEMLGEARD